jgi:hypothetical protein
MTGKSKSVISKALKNGDLSHSGKDDSGYKIDPAELFRVFPKKERNRTAENEIENTYKIKELEARLELESQQKEFFKEQYQKVEQEKEDWKKQAQTLLLTDSRDKEPQKPTETRKGFLATLLGKTG